MIAGLLDAGASHVKSIAALVGGLGGWSLAFGAALLGALCITPVANHKLRAAGIFGIDRQKPSQPKVAEMGGIAAFLAFNVGVFAFLIVTDLAHAEQLLVLAALMVGAGAALTGVIDDLVSLRQGSKAVLPLGFAIPLSVYAPATTVAFPLVGAVDFGLLYPIVLVPLAVTCASNGFNILEGFNGLGAGLGVIIAATLAALAITIGDPIGLVVLVPLMGALLGFLWFNWYPARLFPGDTLTLFTGAMLATGAILAKVEFWAALLFIPYGVEFVLKALSRFKAQNFASRIEPDGTLRYEGRIHSLTHVVMRTCRVKEVQLVLVLWVAEITLAAGVLALAWTLALP